MPILPTSFVHLGYSGIWTGPSVHQLDPLELPSAAHCTSASASCLLIPNSPRGHGDFGRSDSALT